MSKTYIVTEEQLQNALFNIELNKILARQSCEGYRLIDIKCRHAAVEGNIRGIVVTLALLGFSEEVKLAMGETTQASGAAEEMEGAGEND